MAVKIRLKRFGSKKRPVYRLVVSEASKPRNGATLEEIGTYNPRQKPVSFECKQERVQYWLGVGAQPTETVHRLLGNLGLVEKIVKVPKTPGLSKKDKKAQAA